jgi:hypothetical protein
MLALQSDRKFAKIFDLHSFAREVRINYGECADVPRVVDDMHIAISSEIALTMNYDPARSCCVAGDIHNAYNQHGSLAFLVETCNTFNPEPDELYAEINRVWAGVKAFLSLPVFIHGHVFSQSTNQPLAASFDSVQGITWMHGEKWQSHPQTGRYHLWLPAGTYQVNVTSPGLPSRLVTLSSTEGEQPDQDIYL